MKYFFFFGFGILLNFTGLSQVGINNTNPKASLDITATNQANPSNTDGLLIPRIDDFPATAPTAAQQGMMVYLTTASGSNAPGYYYWDNNAGPAAWVGVFGDDDWTDVGADIERQSGDVYIGNTNLTNNDLYISNKIIDWDNTTYNLDPNGLSKVNKIEFENGSPESPSILFSDLDTGFFSPLANTTAYSVNGTEAFRFNNQGNIAIGSTTIPISNYKMYLKSGPNLIENDVYIGSTNNSNSSILINHNTQQGNGITVNANNNYTLSNHSAISATNSLANINTSIASYTTTSNIHGIYNSITGVDSPTIYGVYNYIPNNGSGTHYGTQNRLIGSGNGFHYGTYNILSGNGSGIKYGSYNSISDIAGGIHYGVYSNVQKVSGYAGYFIGRMSFGNISSRYLMPITDGTANQVMYTDGSGILDWVNASSLGTDDQTIDQFNLSGTTLSISLENDGVAPSTVDLSSLQDGDTQNTLDQAYDQGGAGAGRIITADNGAVRINGTDGFHVTGNIGSGATIGSPGAGTRMFFNPRKAAFRAGSINGTQWDNANVGNNSFAVGVNNIASSSNSVALGGFSTSSGTTSVVIGTYATASGNYSISSGYGTIASGSSSIALGVYSTATASSSIAIGANSTASGNNSIAVGNNTRAYSFSEISFGIYPTTYTPASTTVFNNSDRLFVIGNGEDSSNRSNALTIYKSGLMNINDSYNMPLTDGTANQVMTTNGSGQVSFINPSTIFTDTDNQIVDQFSLTGTNLEISLQDDGVAPVLVNLSSLQDADWYETGGTPPNSINDNIYTNGKVGINNPSPTSSLDIVSNSSGSVGQISVTENGVDDGARILFKNSNETTNKWTLFARADNTVNDNYFNIHNTIGGNVLTIKGDGKVGIGTAPSYKFDVRDNSTGYISQIYNTNNSSNADGLRIRLATTSPGSSNYFIGFLRGSPSAFVSGKIVGNGTGVSYATTSDRRLKTNIVFIENSLDLIDKIQPRIYEYKANLGTKEYGFIAQELQTIYPQAVSGDPNGNVETDPMMVDYSRLTPILTAGIKELKSEVETLKKENKQLKIQIEKYEDLEARLSALENNANQIYIAEKANK